MATNGNRPGPARPSRRTLWIAGGAGIAVIIVSVALGIVFTRAGIGVPRRKAPLPGLMTGTAPWGPNTSQLRARLEKLRLPTRTPSSANTAHLRISVRGRSVRVPSGIGLLAGRVAPLYTLSDAGDILGVQTSTRLGLFFKIWGLRFTRGCLGGYCGTLVVSVNGARVPGDPGRLLLRGSQEIVVSIQG